LANGEDCGTGGSFLLTDGSSGGQWRLPNLFELESLRDMRYYEPALSNSAGTGQWIHGDPFINLITNGWYWSSTTNAELTNAAWIMSAYGGNTIGGSKDFGVNYVWPVRGGH
jgi:hypothetical protein